MNADKNALSPHIAATVDAVAQIHADHHMKRSAIEKFVDSWTSRLGRPVTLAILSGAVALWVTVNGLVHSYGYAAVDPPPFPWLEDALTFFGVAIAILILSTQRRADRLAETREQMTLDLASLTERKVAKVIQLIEELRRDSPEVKDRTDQEAKLMGERSRPAEILTTIKELHDESVSRAIDDADVNNGATTTK